MMRRTRIWLPAVMMLAGCGGGVSLAVQQTPAPTAPDAPGQPAAPVVTPTPAAIPRIGYRVVASYPHDPRAFTQGLFWHDGHLFEGTGMEGESEVRRVRLDDGAVLARAPIDRNQFGEGIALWRGEIYSLTWQSQIGYRWSVNGLRRLGSFTYPGEGWGLTSDGTSLILSDGTPDLRFMAPGSFTEQRRITVTANGRPLRRLNELEWIDGAIWANVWMTRWLVRIDPATGVVTGAMDLQPLMEQAGGDLYEKTPNGVAWDPATRRLFVTGKRWNRLFVLELTP